MVIHPSPHGARGACGGNLSTASGALWITLFGILLIQLNWVDLAYNINLRK
jgi:hypothetical protein